VKNRAYEYGNGALTRWALLRPYSPAGNTRRQAPAPAAPRPLRRREQPQGGTKVQGLFRETGAPGSAAFGGRPPAPRPAPVLGGLRPQQLFPRQGPRGSFRCRPRTRAGGSSRGAGAQGRPGRSGLLLPPFPRKRGAALKRLLGGESRGWHRRETRASQQDVLGGGGWNSRVIPTRNGYSPPIPATPGPGTFLTPWRGLPFPQASSARLQPPHARGWSRAVRAGCRKGSGRLAACARTEASCGFAGR